MASGVASFAVFAGLILVLAAVTSRLLGVRFSVGRAVLTGWAGLAGGFGVGYGGTRRQAGIAPLGVGAAGGGEVGGDRGGGVAVGIGRPSAKGRPGAAVAGAGVDGAQHTPLPAIGPDRCLAGVGWAVRRAERPGYTRPACPADSAGAGAGRPDLCQARAGSLYPHRPAARTGHRRARP